MSGLRRIRKDWNMNLAQGDEMQHKLTCALCIAMASANASCYHGSGLTTPSLPAHQPCQLVVFGSLK